MGGGSEEVGVGERLARRKTSRNKLWAVLLGCQAWEGGGHPLQTVVGYTVEFGVRSSRYGYPRSLLSSQGVSQANVLKHSRFREVESALVSAAGLYSSYNRILLTLPPESHSSSEELSLARSELKTTLSTLETDISELDEVVNVLEQDFEKLGHQSRFGISYNEIRKRRAWVTNAQKQLEEMKQAITSSFVLNSSNYHPLIPSAFSNPSNAPINSRHHPPFRDDCPIDIDDAEEFNHEQQSMVMAQQDQTLGVISGVVDVLREQASLMGREISEHNILLEDLDEQIDQTESRLSKANRKLAQFVQENKNSKSSWLILILMVALFILLIAIILL
ncbi:hypothetical protein O181_025885 [Austropuccinia psidii MF-1]|uniref:t-SNARE coiled-coil homology domain-containing protein n=1 Tax=Austropuccinia psidii MF-1 TaxID=1389203 RepID=A0A9Q3CNC9_9BASI|nr:hypothetical protein [Austropuccinia psidii MF-1]